MGNEALFMTTVAKSEGDVLIVMLDGDLKRGPWYWSWRWCN